MSKLPAALACLALLPPMAPAAAPATAPPAPAAATRALTPADAVEWRQRAVADISRIDSPDGRVRAALLLSRMAPVLREGEARAALANLIRSDLGQVPQGLANSACDYLEGRGPATRSALPTVDSIVAELREKGDFALTDVSSAVYNATGNRPLADAELRRVTDAMEAAAAGSQAPGRWLHLARAYVYLAQSALEHQRPERAGRLLDRAVEMLVAHPAPQNPEPAKTYAPDARAVVKLMHDLHREADLNRLAAALPPADRRRVLLEWVAAPLRKGDFAAGRKLIEVQLEGPDRGAELAAVAGVLRRAMDGKSPADGEPQDGVGAVAFGHAAKGDVETAERLLGVPDPHAELEHQTLAGIARAAFDGGHPDAARREMRRAWAWYQKHPEPDTLETQHLANTALEIGADAVAEEVFAGDRSFWLVEPEVALARRRRLAGDLDAARRLLHDAAARAETTPTGDGGPARFLAKVAALGDDLMAGRLIARAAELNEKMNDTFFFAPGGYAAIIGTGADLGRPDLIQRGYDALTRPADRALYAAIAAQAARDSHAAVE